MTYDRIGFRKKYDFKKRLFAIWLILDYLKTELPNLGVHLEGAPNFRLSDLVSFILTHRMSLVLASQQFPGCVLF
jgi:hypothetical protein